GTRLIRLRTRLGRAETPPAVAILAAGSRLSAPNPVLWRHCLISRTLHRRRLLLREKARILIGPRHDSRLPVGESHIAVAGREWHLPAHHSRLPDLVAAKPRHVVETAALELAYANRADTVRDPRISVYICDAYVSNIHATV